MITKIDRRAGWLMSAALITFHLSLITLFTSCSNDDDYSVATGNILSTVTTGEAAVTATTATLAGTVLDLSPYASTSYSVGVVFGTKQDPTTSGKRQAGSIDATSGTVTTSLTELTKGETYYYATYVTLQGKVTQYGEVKSFVTTDAQVAVTDAANITANGADVTITSNVDAATLNVGETEITYGVKLAAAAEDVQSSQVDVQLPSSDKSLSFGFDGLLPGSTYYYAAYFKLGDGLVFSDTKSFTTLSQEMEYVDLGLSVLWAKWNLGASSEEEEGGLYGFGDVTGVNVSTYLNQYPDYDIKQSFEDLGTWLTEAIDGEATKESYTPGEAEFTELLEKTTHEFTEVNGVPGYRFTGKNGNSIFLPAAGYRDGVEKSGEEALGQYWLSEVSPTNSDYGKTISFSESGARQGASKRSLGLSVRTVREPEPLAAVDVDVTKLNVGDLDGNGRIRIEIYNEYGATKENPGLNMAQFKFEKNMIARFNISGISGNLKDGAPGEYYAGFEFAAGGWWPSLWSGFNTQYDAKITGDGEYTVWFDAEGAVDGAVVFCIDIDQLGANLIDPSLVTINSLSLAFDVEDSQMQYYVDNTKIEFNNKDENEVDGRIEIFNEYGNTKGAGVDVSDLSFSGYQIVTYTISGIDGNLKDGASNMYNTELSYAASGWWPSWWGSGDAHDGIGSSVVTGDGSYTVFAPLDGNISNGAVVWTVEIYGLWADLVDPSLVKVNIDKVIIPGKK